LVQISRGHFTRLFIAARGESPGTFLREARFNAAQKLLHTTEKSIAEVAKEVGYRSTSAMDHAFQAAGTRTPREWRIMSRRRDK
jgi:transcriptional regulator GlxA family with amidase domain